MAAQTEPSEEQLRVNATEGILAHHSVWKMQGSQNTKAGVFFPAIGTMALAKEIDAYYQELIDLAYDRGVKDERQRAVY